MKKTIPSNYKFDIPSKIDEIWYDGKFIIISPETANWIVLENREQLEFFNLLKKYNLERSLQIYSGDYDDARLTVTQIVAKQFENKLLESCIKDDTKQLHLYLTNGCNLRCPHCYMFSGRKKDNELSLPEIKMIIEQFSLRGGKAITFSGGEITTHKDLKEIIDYANNHDLKIRLLTNGVLWPTELIDYVASKIDSVQISVDGYSEASNSIIRGENNFNKSLQTIQRFISKKVATEIAITIPFGSVELDESEKYIEFCQNLLNLYPKELFKIKIAEQLIEGREVKLNEVQAEQYSQYVFKIKSRLNGCHFELESFADAFRQNQIMDNCMYGVFAIDAVGDVYFCSRVSSLKPIGNIREMTFDRIFSLSEKAQQLSRIDNFKPCSNCSLKYICGGGCRIDYFPEFAEITDIESVDMTKISARQCTSKIKERFYRLMIESNKKLYR